MVMRRRIGKRGASGLGCLASILVVGVLLFYGINLGKVWWRYWEITDSMKDAARRSYSETDAALLAKLRADVKNIGLPAEAGRFTIERRRNPPMIVITTSYREQIDLPLIRRAVEFEPKIEFRRQ